MTPRLSLRVSIVFLLAASGASRATATKIANAENEFSTVSNPNNNNPLGSWTFGYTDSLGGTFIPYDHYFVTSNGRQTWNSTSSDFAAAGTAVIKFTQEVGNIQPGWLTQSASWFLPGGASHTGYSVIRFTASAIGTYDISSPWQPGNMVSGSNTITLWHNGVVLDSDISTLSPPPSALSAVGSQTSFSSTGSTLSATGVSLLVNDTVDLLVGSTIGFNFDLVRTNLILSTADGPPPPDPYLWTSAAGDARFDTAGNWSGNSVPGATDEIQFGVASNFVTLPLAGATVNSITLQANANPVTFDGVSANTPLTASALTFNEWSTIKLSNTKLAVDSDVSLPLGNSFQINQNAKLDLGAHGLVVLSRTGSGGAPPALRFNGGTFTAASLEYRDSSSREDFSNANIEITGTTGISFNTTNGIPLEVLGSNTTLSVLNGPTNVTGQLEMRTGTSLVTKAITGTAGALRLQSTAVSLHVTGPQGLTLGDSQVVRGSTNTVLTIGEGSRLEVEGPLEVQYRTPQPIQAGFETIGVEGSGVIQAGSLSLFGGTLGTTSHVTLGSNLLVAPNTTISVSTDLAGNSGYLKLDESTIDGGRQVVVFGRPLDDPNLRAYFATRRGLHVGGAGAGTVTVNTLGVLQLDDQLPLVIGAATGAGTVTVNSNGKLSLGAMGAQINSGGLLDLRSGSNLELPFTGTTILVNAGGQMNVAAIDPLAGNNVNVVGGVFDASAASGKLGNDTEATPTSFVFSSEATGRFGSVLQLSGVVDVSVTGGSHLTADAIYLGDDDAGISGSASSFLTVGGAGSRITPTGSSMPLRINGTTSVTYFNRLTLQTGGLVDTGTAATTLESGGRVLLDGGTLRTSAVLFGQNSSPNHLVFNSGTLALTRSSGYTVSATSELGDNPRLETGRTLMITNITTIPAGKSITLDGGTLSTGAVALTGGSLNLNSGTLGVTGLGGLTVGVGSSNLTLAVGSTANVMATTIVAAGSTLTLSGGTLNTGALALTGGSFNFTAGTLGVTGADGLTVGAGGPLGSAFNLGASQAVTVINTATINPGASFTLSGGLLSAGTAINNGTLTMNAGAISAGAGGLTNTVTGRIVVPSGAAVAIDGPATNALGGRITLGGNYAQLAGTDLLTNSGVILGDGQIVKSLTNSATGDVRIAANQSIILSGATTNGGRINNLGGTLEIDQPFVNSSAGAVTGHGLFFFHSGVASAGQFQLSAGNSDLYGDVSLTGGNNGNSKLLIGFGNNGVTIYGNLVHNGAAVNTGDGSKLIVFGEASGAGSFTGPGSVDFEGGYSPGNSPAATSFDGDLYLGANGSLTMELAGPTPGSQHDKLNVGGSLFANGTMNVELLGDFAPASGQVFDLLDWGSLVGQFSSINLPSLASSLRWNTSQLYTKGIISVGTPGDFSGDGFNNAADYVLARKRGGVDGQANLDAWRSNFGASASGAGGASAVPEPSVAALLAICAFTVALARRQTS